MIIIICWYADILVFVQFWLNRDPKELHKWIKIMLDLYHLNKEETDIREARQMTPPMVIQRLFILKQTVEEEYFEKETMPGEASKSEEP